jgi:hypothetical protein
MNGPVRQHGGGMGVAYWFPWPRNAPPFNGRWDSASPLLFNARFEQSDHNYADYASLG